MPLRDLSDIGGDLATYLEFYIGEAQTAATQLAMAGFSASRSCAPGRMQAPPLGWRHDGQLLLAPLGRTTEREAIS